MTILIVNLTYIDFEIYWERVLKCYGFIWAQWKRVFQIGVPWVMCPQNHDAVMTKVTIFVIIVLNFWFIMITNYFLFLELD